MPNGGTARDLSLDLLKVPEHEYWAELCRRSLYTFLVEFWDTIVPDPFRPSWHIEYLCDEIQAVIKRAMARKPKKHDLVINVPPGTTKSTVLTKMAPAWVWINDPTMSGITGSHSLSLALKHANMTRDVINSPKFKLYFPDLMLRRGKDSASDYQVSYRKPGEALWRNGGSRYSCSVGASPIGLHGGYVFGDDLIDPEKADAVSDLNRKAVNHWYGQTLSMRVVDKEITPFVLIMQRLHQDDPTGHLLANGMKTRMRHINLPGMLVDDPMIQVKPKELEACYIDGMLDPDRMGRDVLKDMEARLGQYGFSGQVLQNPVPPGGGMFKPDNLKILTAPPGGGGIRRRVMYWDKAGTAGGGAYTVGVQMWEMRTSPRFVIVKIVRGQWESSERERIILDEAKLAGRQCKVMVEQEPGSGGKESAQGTIRNLAGFNVKADHPTGDKAYRADPWSVQVNAGNVGIVNGPWLNDFIEEMRYFPLGRYKDQIDAGSGAFNELASGKRVGAF